MILVRAWRRQLLGGVGAALVVPGSILGALAVLALAGGFAGLGVLGQAFSGPSLPVASLDGGRGVDPARTISTVVLATLASARVATPTAGGAPAGSRSGAGGGHRRSPVASGVRGSGGSAPPARQPPPATAQPPAPQPRPQPTLTDEVVGAATSVTARLPAPAGAAVTAALLSAAATVDGIFPVPVPGPPKLP